jgi:hypothetical protein
MAGEFGGCNGLAGVALSVFGDVDGETDCGGLQTLTPDLADISVLRRGQMAEDLFVEVKGFVDGVEPGLRVVARLVIALFALGFQRLELFRTQLTAFEVGAKAISAAGEMFQVKARGTARVDGRCEILPDLAAGTEEVPDHGIYIRKYAAEPGFCHMCSVRRIFVRRGIFSA